MTGGSAPLILASASPQRARLLEQLGLAFKVVPADIDETHRPGEAAQTLARRLAQRKAEALIDAYPQALIIGSDTVVALGDTIYAKPADAEQSRKMLASLAGAQHTVASGVALWADGAIDTRVCVTQVTMRQLSAAEIAAYIASGETWGKAGGYAIQGRGALFIEHLAGSYSAVMGLPLYETGQLLRAAGVEPLPGA